MEFDTWLSQRLSEIKTDEAVFGPYIKSILEGDEDQTQKIEDLDGILSELGTTPSMESLTSAEIISRWDDYQVTFKDTLEKASKAKEVELAVSNGDGSEIDKQLEQLLRLSPDRGITTTLVGGPSTNDKETDSALRAAILKQYQEDASDSDGDNGSGKPSGSTMDGLAKNTNASSVLNAQKEMKEQARADAAKKREKDKEDRARQKKLAEEKKEKAKKKTAKVERNQKR